MKHRIAVLAVSLLAVPVIAAVNSTGKGYAAAIVMEPATGRVLFEENAHASLPTASMAKMMTLLIAMEQIEAGKLHLDTPVTITTRAGRMGGSQIYAARGQVFSMRTLIAATMVQSANDAAEAIAEKIAGSAEAFAAMMNEKARRLGLEAATFYDPHGLPNRRDPSRVDRMSAFDLAILGREVMRFPLLREYAKTPWLPFENGTFTSGLTNPNHLINPASRDYFPDATGIKTGYSDPAGYCVTASARRDGMDLICVVMGAEKPWGDGGSLSIATRLMKDAFDRYHLQSRVHKGEAIGNMAVANGRVKSVPVVAARDVTVLVERGDESSLRMTPAGSPTAPIRRGQQVGWIVIRENGEEVARIPAVAAADVEEEPWWRAFWPF